MLIGQAVDHLTVSLPCSLVALFTGCNLALSDVLGRRVLRRITTRHAMPQPIIDRRAVLERERRVESSARFIKAQPPHGDE